MTETRYLRVAREQRERQAAREVRRKAELKAARRPRKASARYSREADRIDDLDHRHSRCPSGCAYDGSVDWGAVGAITLGIGAAALGAAEVYEDIVSPPTVVVVCRGYWRC